MPIVLPPAGDYLLIFLDKEAGGGGLVINNAAIWDGLAQIAISGDDALITTKFRHNSFQVAK